MRHATDRAVADDLALVVDPHGGVEVPAGAVRDDAGEVVQRAAEADEGRLAALRGFLGVADDRVGIVDSQPPLCWALRVPRSTIFVPSLRNAWKLPLLLAVFDAPATWPAALIAWPTAEKPPSVPMSVQVPAV